MLLFFTQILFFLYAQDSIADAEKAKFINYIESYQGHYIKGRSSNILNEWNLDTDTRVKYNYIKQVDLIRFHIVDNGNRHVVSRRGILFPTNGNVVFDIKNEDGSLKNFKLNPIQNLQKERKWQ